MYNRFKANIIQKGFITKNQTVLACVSGGADSILLFHFLLKYSREFPFKLYCAHVNHMMRIEGDDDEAFVRNLCLFNNIPFFSYKINIASKASGLKQSMELVGRDVRYDFFNSIPCDSIMTAHNMNDVAESMLLHFIRGSGMDGLCGIPEKRNTKICRPLLLFSAKEIRNYLTENNIPWKEDITNSDVSYTRNKVRHELIPLIEEINPSFLKAVSRSASILSEENSFIKDAISGNRVYNHDTKLSISELIRYPLALQRRIIHELGFDFHDVDKIISLIKCNNGTTLYLSNNRKASKEYDFISIYYGDQIKNFSEIELPEKGSVIFGEYLITIGEEGWIFPKGKYSVRTRQEGDYFYPEGMVGRKKIKDFFIEKKIPRRTRDQIPLIVLGDKIFAVANLRKSNFVLQNNDETIHIKIEKMNFA